MTSMGWDGKMFEPWPVSAGDGEDQDCDCDECGVSKRPKRRRCLILPSGDEDAGIQPQALASPPVPSARPLDNVHKFRPFLPASSGERDDRVKQRAHHAPRPS